MTDALEAPVVFDLRLPQLTLDHGGAVDPLVVRGWLWTAGARAFLQQRDLAVVDVPAGQVVRRDAEADAARPIRAPVDPAGSEATPTILVIHALTGDAIAGGNGGWWSPVIGPGRPLDPTTHRILCFNNLGSCYGTSNADDRGFSPGPLTTWDQARTLLAALDALGIDRLALVTGGSLGAMVTLSFAALAPDRVERISPIAGCASASSWIIGFNHVQRQAIAGARNPDDGLSMARQIAMLSYRAEPGLDARQGRQRIDPTSSAGGLRYRMQSYLEHQGTKLVGRFTATSYLAMMDAMDNHDVVRPPLQRNTFETWSWPDAGTDGFDRIKASCLAIGIDTDQLFFPVHSRATAEALAARGVRAEYAEIRSPHGHDGFLIEWDQLGPLLSRALSMPPGSIE